MNRRGSGILLHITSLPSPFGIGDFGPWAYRFADFLSQTQQSYWQVLPLSPTDQSSGNSPYSSISVYAGNTLLISPELLIEWGYLTPEEIPQPPPFPRERCDYPSVITFKSKLLLRAYKKFKSGKIDTSAYEEFCSQHNAWLEDVALFLVIKNRCRGKVWPKWDRGLRDRDPGMLGDMKKDFHDAVEQEKFLQYLFFTQWFSLKSYCNKKGIKLVGDIPIYVNYDSVDAWTHPEIFKLNKQKQPIGVAGVPPDYFSETGQLWENPVYQWDILQTTGYQWWMQRIAHNCMLFDALRIDHFRGFVAFWEVPYGEKTAINGRWVTGPAEDFFTTLRREFPSIKLIAEDLGYITPDVREIMQRFGFPGMRVLLFAFGEDQPAHPYLPHNYIPQCVVYTGTHDNNTAKGWFENETTPQDRQRLCRYLGREAVGEHVHDDLIRLALGSVADMVIIPMQDILGLGQEARMNRPSTISGNWEWRLVPEQLTPTCGEFLGELTCIYGRAP